MPDESAGVFDFDALSLAELRRRQGSKWRDIEPGELPAWVADMDVRLAPPIEKALVGAVRMGDTGYSPERSAELAEAFSAFDRDALEAALARDTAVLLLNNPHNPTGKAFTRAELVVVLDVARRHRVFVLSDEIHAPLALTDRPHVPWPSVATDAADHGLVLTGGTKAFNLAGLKCGLVLSSGRGADLVARLPAEFRLMAGLLGVIASVAAFRDGEAWLDALAAHLRGNLELEGRAFDAEHGAGRVRLNFGTTRPILTEILDRLTTAVS